LAQATIDILMVAYYSIWIYQTIAVYHNPHHVSSGANPELRTLFYKMAHLLNSCIVPVFVFDGPRRPAIKRNRRVRQGAHWLMQDLCELIDAFGFYSHQVSDGVHFQCAMSDFSCLYRPLERQRQSLRI
jgi:hypothetical protein